MNRAKRSGQASAVVVGLLLFGGLMLFGFVALASDYNNFVGFETQIEAIHDNSRNIHSKFTNTIKSQGLTVEKYGDLAIKAIQAGMSGRYGPSGSQAAMQWIKEQNPSIDSTIFQKLQTAIEVGYAEFAAVQTSKLDVKAAYQRAYRSFPHNISASMLGYPKTDMNKFGSIVTSEATEKAFDSGKSGPVDPFSNK